MTHAPNSLSPAGWQVYFRVDSLTGSWFASGVWFERSEPKKNDIILPWFGLIWGTHVLIFLKPGVGNIA